MSSTLAINSSQKNHLCALYPKLASLDCQMFLSCSSPTSDLQPSFWVVVLLLLLGDSTGEMLLAPLTHSLAHSLAHSLRHLAFLEFQFCAGITYQSYTVKKILVTQEAYSLRSGEQKAGTFKSDETGFQILALPLIC